MATYTNGRRAPNVSQYLANLNTVPTQQEIAAQSDFSLADDGLDFLTNTEFFDFDNFNANVADFAQGTQPPTGPGQNGGNTTIGLNAPRYQFGEFQTYPSALVGSPTSIPTSPSNGLSGSYSLQPVPQPFSAQPNTGDKRKASAANMASPVDMEETSRMAVEEDKRRRNTAASARFRVKKKQREQALEKQAKEMTDKVQQLESKVQQLEMENKWLKELITEKSDAKLAEEGKAEGKEGEERSSESHTDGVGTLEEDLKPLV